MKVMLACGGTGGHIFPAFSVAEEFRKKYPSAEIVYVCGKKDIENAIFRIVAGEKVISVDSAPFRGGVSFLTPRFWLKVISGIFTSVKALILEKPDIVVGFGGYFSFPAVFAARVLGKKTVVHEQNVVPGVANRWMARFAHGVAVSYPETLNYWPRRHNFRITGNPIRSSIERDCREEALDYFNFSGGKKTVLVLGGSQGAESINTLFLRGLSGWPEKLREKIQVLHLCGRMDPESAKVSFTEAGLDARVYSFFERMDLAYAAADLAVGRSGATFLAEIASKGLPAILIPYPYGNGHQRVNAEVFRRSRPEVVVLEQRALTPEALSERLIGALERLDAPGARRPAPGAASNSRAALADFIVETLKN